MSCCRDIQLYVFESIYIQKIWGGRSHELIYNRRIPEKLTGAIGESWELCDRPEAVSKEIFTGRDLHELWTSHRKDIFGASSPASERFPLLVKLIDAADNLSVQVHPPEHVAENLGVEPKTEMWYFLKCRPDAKILAGFSKKVSPEEFLRATALGSVQNFYHTIQVKTGDVMFLPSGRVHAIGAGNMLLEVQQNSDTTFRIYDWDRLDLDGKPRQLHIEQAIDCIDFDDVRPELQKRCGSTLVRCPFFTVQQVTLTKPFCLPGKGESFVFLFNEKGVSYIAGHRMGPGDFALLPASAEHREIHPIDADTSVVFITWGQQKEICL